MWPDWYVDFEKGTLTLGKYEFRVQFLGSESYVSNSWLWGWGRVEGLSCGGRRVFNNLRGRTAHPPHKNLRKAPPPGLPRFWICGMIGGAEVLLPGQLPQHAVEGGGVQGVVQHILAEGEAVGHLSDTREPLDEATVAQKKAQAEDFLAQLRAAEDPIALFDDLMNEHSEDSGLSNSSVFSLRVVSSSRESIWVQRV